jgi:hypothetical protein
MQKHSVILTTWFLSFNSFCMYQLEPVGPSENMIPCSRPSGGGSDSVGFSGLLPTSLDAFQTNEQEKEMNFFSVIATNSRGIIYS